jgi:hypothetical protein
MRRGLGLIVVVGVTVLAGCGGSSHHAATEPRLPYAVALPGLGILIDGCFSGGKVLSAFSAEKATATETVSVEGDEDQHLLLRTLNPPAGRLTAPPAPYHELTWRVVQSTEPKTIVETIVQRFAPGGCAVAGSVPTTRVISHAGKWTPPSPWA